MYVAVPSFHVYCSSLRVCFLPLSPLPMYVAVPSFYQVDVDKASVVWEAYLHHQLFPQRLSTIPVKSDRAQSILPVKSDRAQSILPVKSDRAQSNLPVKSDRAQSNFLHLYERGPFLRPLSLILFDDAAILTMPYGELGTLIHVMSGQ